MPTPGVAKKFVDTIKGTLLMSEENKKYWIKESRVLPDAVLESICDVIQAKNLLMEKHIQTALSNDHDRKYLQELKHKINQIKTDLVKMAEKTETGSAEIELENNLKNL